MQSLMYSIKQLKLLYYLFKMSKNLLKASSMMKERIAVLPTIQEMTTKGDSKQWIKKHANRLIVSIVLIQQENVSGIQYLECVTHNQGHKQFKNKINTGIVPACSNNVSNKNGIIMLNTVISRNEYIK